jgi:thioredoxin reductase (NADPH)
VFLLTGYLADLDFLKRCGIVVRSNNVPEHDAESFETNVPGLYLAGAVVAGANRGEVFIENGRFHGQVVVGHIVKQLGNQVVTA